MLLEVPNMAMQAIDPSNKRVISKVLRRALEAYDKQQYTGPPETAKEIDSVVAAAKDLQRGDWAKACAQLEGLQLWHHIETWIWTRDAFLQQNHHSYSVAQNLGNMHHVPKDTNHPENGEKVKAMITEKMKEEITAFWDESSKYVLVQHVEPTPLQRLAITLAERAVQAVENNERLVDLKSGGFAFKEPVPSEGLMSHRGPW
eukprot:g32112.t1